MLDASSPASLHVLQNVLLILLSFFFLPLDLTILTLSYAINRVYKIFGKSDDGTQHEAKRPRTILVTGVGMTKGLTLARLFHKAGHRIIGADFEPNCGFVPGRGSRALNKFYRLDKPNAKCGSGNYIQGLLNIILEERVDLWVSCSGVASAVEDGEAKEIIENRTHCLAIQFDVATTQTLHEKHTFISHTKEMGMRVPETHTITSRKELDSILEKAPKERRYIMKTIGMNDQARGDLTLLPLRTEFETKKHLDRLVISDWDPWVLQQFVRGEEYCTHALVVRGKVKVFVACPSSELLMHYEALPRNSVLSQAMLRFTKQYAEKGGPGFTGHLSFDFLVEAPSLENAGDIVLYPIECNPRAHTAVALFNNTPSMADAYMSIFDKNNKAEASVKVVYPQEPGTKYYWIGHDLVAYILYPLLKLLTLQGSLTDFALGMATFVVHLIDWKDGTYELWDPLPWFLLYHVYWPMQFIACLTSGKKWSRINVSTLKMFEC